MTFTHKIRVRFGETDSSGSAFHGHWLSYFDDAAVRYLETLGFPPKDSFGPSVVVKAVVEWAGAAEFDDEIDIVVDLIRVGTSSFDLQYLATVDTRRVCEATITHVTIDPQTARSRPIPEKARPRLEAVLADK